MLERDNVSQILLGMGATDKTYSFDDKHDPRKPIDMWFQESNEGTILFIIFYTQACRWSRCLSCNLPSKCSKFHVSYKAIKRQVDWVFKNEEVLKQRENIRKVIISNNGSVLDQETFSSNALMYLTLEINEYFPNLQVLSLETRPEYVDPEELKFLSRAVKEGDTATELELAVGFEVFDDNIRNNILKKGLDKTIFEKLADEMAKYHFRIKAYVMLKPVPGMTDEEAVNDVINCARYFASLVDKYRSEDGELRLKINMHLNSTYVAAGTPLEKAFEKGEYIPPRLWHTAKAVLATADLPISIYVALSDEGLAVKGGSFFRDGDEAIRSALDKFNVLQDYDILRAIIQS